VAGLNWFYGHKPPILVKGCGHASVSTREYNALQHVFI